MKIKNSAKVMGIASLLLVLPLLSIPIAYASTQGTGGYVITFTPVAVTSDGGNTRVQFTFTETITGAASGTRLGQGTLVIHPDGTINVHEAGTFTGTIAGRSGTATMTVEAQGTLASVVGEVVVTQGMGGLAGVHGVVAITGAATSPLTIAGSYLAEVHFDP